MGIRNKMRHNSNRYYSILGDIEVDLDSEIERLEEVTKVKEVYVELDAVAAVIEPIATITTYVEYYLDPRDPDDSFTDLEVVNTYVVDYVSKIPANFYGSFDKLRRKYI